MKKSDAFVQVSHTVSIVDVRKQVKATESVSQEVGHQTKALNSFVRSMLFMIDEKVTILITTSSLYVEGSMVQVAAVLLT